MRTIGAVGIVIPARNEADHIVNCVRSVRYALAGCPVPSWIVVVADSCDDSTAARARFSLGDAGEVLECQEGCVGGSRRVGASRVLTHWSGLEAEKVWLANTDADSEVCPSWVSRQLCLAKRGVCAVAGIVRIDTPDIQLAARFRNHYRVAPDGTHEHVHGANLGVRMDAYLDVGGWPRVRVGEDRALWSLLGVGGWRRRAVNSSVVLTSARIVGRADGGFAQVLMGLTSRQGAACEAPP